MKKQTLPGNKRTMSPWILIVFPIFCFLGYNVGAMVSEGRLGFDGFGQTFVYYILHPFPLVLDRYTGMGILMGAGLATLIVLYYVSGN